MKTIRPVGARLLVKDLEPEADLVRRGARSGLTVVVNEENVPRPTSGLVMAVGSDPLTQEEVSVGDVVMFHPYAGHFVSVEGETFRSLELREITSVIRESPDPAPAPEHPEPDKSTPQSQSCPDAGQAGEV